MAALLYITSRLCGKSWQVNVVVAIAPSWERAYRPSVSSAPLGPSATRIAALSALRSIPMTLAASTPWPTTSPTDSASRPSGRSTTSYQSPQAFMPFSAGR